MLKIVSAFWSGLTAPYVHAEKRHCHVERKMRSNLTEDQLDRMLMDSCDASDPISIY